MAQKEVGCLRKVELFLREVRKHYSVEAAYLFGSHAKGMAASGSDIDMAIVSKDFNSMAPLDRLVALGKIAWKAGIPEIEAIGYTPEEFYDPQPWDFPDVVQKEGIVVL